MKCRLTSGKEPTVQFSWLHNGKPVVKGAYFKIKTRKSGSVLNIRGLPETAGHYTCTATSLAGQSNVSSTLYVHGTVHSACGAAYCLNGGACSVAVVAPGEHQVVCQCVAGYAGARCELKHVQGMLTSDVVIIFMLVLCLTVIVLLMLHISNRLKKIEAQEYSRKCEMTYHPAPLLDKHKLQNGKPLTPTNNVQHCGYVKSNSQSPQPNRKLQVTKSASSPGMQSMAINHSPTTNSLLPCSSPESPGSASLLHLGSSQSSVQSTGSVKMRRPAAPDNLTINLTSSDKNELLPSNDNTAQLPLPSPSPSPLYVEPWDKAICPCIHGTGDIKCDVCHREADNIVTQCNTWSNNI